MTDYKVVPPMSKDMMVAIVLDQSSSMGTCLGTTIAGFNEYVQTLRESKAEGEITLSLSKFPAKESTVEVVYVGKKLGLVPDLSEANYKPDGMTPLRDAVGITVREIDERLSKMAERPQVTVVIITDGGENQSREFSESAVKELIQSKEKAGGWSFVFIGANQDAWTTGTSLGVRSTNVSNYSTGQTKAMFTRLGAATARYADSASRGLDVATQSYFTEDEQKLGDKEAGR